jgi:predicted CXXCH cytochrome family protein
VALALSPAATRAQEPPSSQPAETTPDVVQSFAGGIIGSKHDFTAGGSRDLCLPCHTPHITAAEAPLLTRRPADIRRTQGYGAFGVELNAASLLCLSCHDGVVASDVFTGPHAMTWSERSGDGIRGNRLTSHPIGTPYPTGEPKYASAAAVISAGLPLPKGQIQCTTCHDPHNTGGHAGMLVISNERSRLCLACHRL